MAGDFFINMKKLWQKKYQLNKLAEDYCSGENVILDNKLVKHDVLGSIAHAIMLKKIEILTEEELIKLRKCLSEILFLTQKGKFNVIFGDEDVHTKIENYLTTKLGDLGKKIHTGRSRNDQVLLDLRLFTKQKLFNVVVLINQLIDTFINYAKKYEFVLMPGYTHMQKAMPSSIGLWASSFAESLLDDLQLLKAVYKLNDQSPLGSGAAYGVPLPIDRNLTAKLLGFSKAQNNSLYCQASRPKIQLAIMHAFTQIMLTLSRFAQDVLLFTTSEFNFFIIAPDLCTGSSIMPQKKNVDIMEFVRAKTYTVISYEQTIASISAGLTSGYHADFGETKKPFIDAFENVLKTIEIITLTVKSLIPNQKILQKACTSELFATHAAYLLVKKGLPFRKAYQKIASHLGNMPEFNHIEILKETNHPGGTGNLGLSKLKNTTKKELKWWKKQQVLFNNSLNKMKGGEK
jgi:argininosuccinate lyase